MSETYQQHVDYSVLDPFKTEILSLLKETSRYIERLGIRIIPESIGAPAILFEFDGADFLLAFKSDGVGTKNLVEDDYYAGVNYANFIVDLIAMNVNDLLCVGAVPFALADEIASGSNEWFKDESRIRSILDGFRIGCQQAKIVVPCGETPTLNRIINPHTVNITGASLGIVRPKSRAFLGEKVQSGDIIYGLASSGIHANGLSLARRVIETLPERSETIVFPTSSDAIPLPIGLHLMRPTKIYVPEIVEMFDREIELHYLTNITGSGWKKMMRCPRPFTYIVNAPEPPPIFRFLQEHNPGGQLSDYEAYQTYNMGIGFAIIAPESSANDIRECCERFGTKVYRLGFVQEGPRSVIIRSHNIVYGS